jgi:hypothetical protein
VRILELGLSMKSCVEGHKQAMMRVINTSYIAQKIPRNCLFLQTPYAKKQPSDPRYVLRPFPCRMKMGRYYAIASSSLVPEDWED